MLISILCCTIIKGAGYPGYSPLYNNECGIPKDDMPEILMGDVIRNEPIRPFRKTYQFLRSD